MTRMKGKIGDQPERVESQLLQLSPGLALAWAAGAVVHLRSDYHEDLHRHHQPSAHDLNYWNLLCLASRPCNTPGGDDHQVNRHIHWDEVWADFRPEHYFIFFKLLFRQSSKREPFHHHLVQLVRMTPVPRPTIDILGPFHRSVQPGLLVGWTRWKNNEIIYKWMIYNWEKQTVLHGLSPGSQYNTRTHNRHWEMTSNIEKGCLAKSLEKKDHHNPNYCLSLLCLSSARSFSRLFCLTAWVMNDAPLCKCKSSVGCQSACSSWNWTHLDPSSAEIYIRIKWGVLLKISIHIQKPRICNRLRESISSDNDMSPCSAEAFPQDLPSHCCQQSLQAHWVCIRNCVKIVLILENPSLSFLTRQGACYNMQWRHGSRLSGSSSSLQARPPRTLRQRWWPLPGYGLKLCWRIFHLFDFSLFQEITL